jgi:hypothetical protein
MITRYCIVEPVGSGPPIEQEPAAPSDPEDLYIHFSLHPQIRPEDGNYNARRNVGIASTHVLVVRLKGLGAPR